MDENYIRKKIVELRLSRKLSERKLSLALGKNSGYINSITNGKYLPSWNEFLCLCEYFDITPKDFFTSEEVSPKKLQAKILLDKVDEDDLDILMEIIKRFHNNSNTLKKLDS